MKKKTRRRTSREVIKSRAGGLVNREGEGDCIGVVLWVVGRMKGGGVDGVDALWDYGGWVVGKWEGEKLLDWDIMMMGIVLCYRG